MHRSHLRRHDHEDGVPIKKRLWYEVGLPKKWAIRAGSPVEKKVLMPVFTTAAVGAMLFLLPEMRILFTALLGE